MKGKPSPQGAQGNTGVQYEVSRRAESKELATSKTCSANSSQPILRRRPEKADLLHRICGFLGALFHAFSGILSSGLGGIASFLGAFFRGFAGVFSSGLGGFAGLHGCRLGGVSRFLCRCVGCFASIVGCLFTSVPAWP